MVEGMSRSLGRRMRRFGTMLPSIVILAVTCGACTLIGSAFETLWISPIDLPDPERLLFVWESHEEVPDSGHTISQGLFFDLEAGSEDLAETALVVPIRPILWAGDHSVALAGSRVSADFLEVLGITPSVGRDFASDDEDPSALPGLLITHDLWQRFFGGTHELSRLKVRIDFGNGIQDAAVLGVLPKGRSLGPPLLWEGSEVLAVLPRPSAVTALHYTNRSYRLLARLHPGASLSRLQERLQVLHRESADRFPATFERWGLRAERAEEVASAPFERALVILVTLGSLLLLVACANVVILTWDSHESRSQELGIRMAIGASSGQIYRLLVAESMTLVLIAAVPGILPATVLSRFLSVISHDPQVQITQITGKSLLGAVGLLLVLTASMSLMPVAGRKRLSATLRLSGRGTSETHRQHQLLPIEIAAAFLALAVALAVSSDLLRLLRDDLGFEPKRLLTVDLRQSSDHGGDVFLYERAARAVESLPGVARAGIVRALPMDGSLTKLVARNPDVDRSTQVTLEGIGPGALESFGLPVLQGRSVSPADLDVQSESWERPAWISRSLAKSLLLDDPIGHGLLLGSAQSTPVRIVGVVEDMQRTSPGEPKDLVAYIPFTAFPRLYAYLLVRTIEEPEAGLSRAIEQTIRGTDPRLVVERTRPQTQIVAARLERQRLMTFVSLALTLLSLVLAASGVWAVAVRRITSRRRELGIRIALGASPAELRRGLLRGAAVDLAVGLALGGVGAYLLRGLLVTLIGDVSSPFASGLPAAVGLAGLVFGTFALAARRLYRLDPASLLKGG